MSDQSRAGGPRQVVRREVPEIDAATRAKLAYLSTQGVIPDACMDCDGVAVVQPVGGAYRVHTFHRTTCPAGRSMVREQGGHAEGGTAADGEGGVA